MHFKMANHVHMSCIRPLFVDVVFFIPGWNAGGQVITITHYTYYSTAQSFKIQPNKGKSINNGKMWVAKLDVGVMKILNIKFQFNQIIAIITIMRIMWVEKLNVGG